MKQDLRKLAEEIAYKYELTDGVFIDDAINAMLSFHEQASKGEPTKDIPNENKKPKYHISIKR